MKNLKKLNLNSTRLSALTYEGLKVSISACLSYNNFLYNIFCNINSHPYFLYFLTN